MSAATPAILPPIPVPTQEAEGYWEAAREGRFAIQRCSACRTWFHPPEVICTRCGCEKLSFETASGRGTIYSYSVMYDKRVRGFEHRVPYVSIWVELEEQKLLIAIGNLLDVKPEDVKIGLPVEVVFEKLNDKVTLPQFRLAKGAKK